MSMKVLPSGQVEFRKRENGKHLSRKTDQAQLEAMFWAYFDPTPTLDEIARDWWENRVSTRAKNTQKLYWWLWTKFIYPHLAATEVGRINPQVIEDWLNGLDTPIPTKLKALAVLSQILSRAVKEEWLPANPCLLVDRPKPPRPERLDIPTVSQVEALRDLATPRDSMFIGLMAYAGLAAVDAMAVDYPTNGELRGRRQKTQEPFRFPVARVLPTFAAEIASYRQRDGATQMRGPIIGKLGYPSWRQRVWYGKLGAPFNPYLLRHLFVSLMLRDPEVQRAEAAEWAGHNLKSQERYSHVLEEGPQRADEAIQLARGNQRVEEVAL